MRLIAIVFIASIEACSSGVIQYIEPVQQIDTIYPACPRCGFDTMLLYHNIPKTLIKYSQRR